MSREEYFSSYKQYESFQRRHIGPTSPQENQMLQALGYKDIHTFISDVVPSNIAIEKSLAKTLDAAKSEVEVIAEADGRHQRL